ncbi:hypothetical protein K3495_g8154 [Podosphaera aphanis]|nr:hypothetical protein K3495_g8154 [Podosphaera aphanis]
MPNSSTSAPNHQLPPIQLSSYLDDDDLDSLFVEPRTTQPLFIFPNRGTQEMSQRSQHQGRPRAENSSRQTVIDLTSDLEDVPPRRSRMSHGPQRSSGSSGNNTAGLRAFVDLTEDLTNDFVEDITEGFELDTDEIIVTGSRLREIRQAAARQARRRQPNNRQPNNRQRPGVRPVSSTIYMPTGPTTSSTYRIPNTSSGLAAGLARLGQMFSPHIMGHIPTALINFSAFQSMPAHMDYTRSAFDQKPEHVPPPAARDSFTRSPTKDDIIICPSCRQELVANKKDPIPKKGGKAPSKKDREEHPFWVVKECGHVYCNACFQNRGDKSLSATFRDENKPPNAKVPANKKTLTCAIDDCNSVVNSKDKWVGVFL